MRDAVRRLGLAAALLLLLLLPGCGLGKSMEELMTLPRLPEEHLELQRMLDSLQAEGASFSAPVSGSYRQSVLFYDVNGDGVEEALAFFRTSGEHPLKIYVFIRSGSRYETAAVVEGDGASIESITFLDMDGDGWTELVVGWGMGEGLRMLSVYSLKSFQVSAVATADYTQYTVGDMDRDGRSEVLLVRLGEPEKGGAAERISLERDGETLTVSARLSAGVEAVSRIVCSPLADGNSALYVEGSLPGGLVTDVLFYQDGSLRNITLDPETDVSEDSLRASTVGMRDMDGDGIPEIPIPRILPAQGETAYRALDWYAFDSRGRRRLQLTTYHNFSDSWYLILPREWGDRITIRREDGAMGERAVVFSRWNGEGEAVTDFLIVYAITGVNREELAARPGRQRLYSGADAIYAFSLLPGAEDWAFAPTPEDLRQSFGLIYSEWISGLQ